MNIYCILYFVFTSVTLTISADVSVKGDLCSKFDSCFSKPQQRTCSCAQDCQLYGTCCHDFSKHVSRHSFSVPFLCDQQRMMTPVFVKRSCPHDYRGHIMNVKACFEDNIDEMDVANNLPVTSYKTKVTYWNQHCAVCNEEDEVDLLLWNIEVFCPQRENVDKWLIRTNLTFDEDNKQWILDIGGELLQCEIKYSIPLYADEVKHCTPNLISSCPANYTRRKIINRCSQYYGERKLKNSDKYYKNANCAICNGVRIKDLECPGMTKADKDVEETEFRDMVEEVFTDGKWLEKEEGQRYICSQGFRYDPFWKKCRKFEMKVPEIVMSYDMSSSHTLRVGLSSWLVILFVLLS